MARHKHNKVRKVQPNGPNNSNKKKKRQDEPHVLLGNFTFLDMFPYKPSYEFNGFRSALGAALTVIFLFAVFLNIVNEISDFECSPPIVKVSFNKLLEFKKPGTIAVPRLAIGFRRKGFEPFYDETYFRFNVLQGSSIRGNPPQFSKVGLEECSLTDPDGFVRFSNLRCPTSSLSMQGDDNLEFFRFVRVEVEQCINWTRWTGTQFEPHRGSTTSEPAPHDNSDPNNNSPPPLCAPQAEIEQVMREGTFTLYFEESDIRTDTEDKKEFRWLRKIQRQAPSAFFFTHTSFIQLKLVETKTRYILGDEHEDTYLSIASEDTSFADITEVILPRELDGMRTNLPHLFRMAFVLRLDAVYQKVVREPLPLYDLFTNFGGVTFFFLVMFGGAAVMFNKHTFKQQTKGLDLRKLDNSQFDKFGNLIDKSFQMPRELQDMTAE